MSCEAVGGVVAHGVLIVLIRHGETVENAARVLQREDTALNARGLRQAAQTAARLATLDIAQIVSSDSLRARMTAEPLLQRTGAACEYTPLLQERNFGELRGRTFRELGLAVFEPDFVPPGGESWAAFHQRVDRAWAHILRLSERVRGAVAVVTHGLVCSSLAARRLRLAAGQEVPPRWSNASVTLCSKRPPHVIERLNCVAHLEPLEDDPNVPLA